MSDNTVNIKNKKASFEYEFVDKLIAGVVLQGTEIKSIRASKVSFTDAFCTYINGELWLRGIHISEYKYGTYYNHEPKRDRKLLLNKKELNKWHSKLKESALTIVPTRMFITERGFAKVEIALARGKKTHDKREVLKEKDTRKEMDRALKNS